MFDDYLKKQIGKRIEVTFTQSEDVPIFPWEIGYFVNKLNTSYYKFEILNSISNAINSGILPENIIMMDRSLPLNNIYEDFDILDFNEKGLFHLYNIGRPLSLIPNKKTAQLSLLLSLFRSLNEFLYSSHIRPNRISMLNDLWPLINEGKFRTIIDILNDKAIESLKKKKISEYERLQALIYEYRNRLARIESEFSELEIILPKIIKENSLVAIQQRIPKKLYNKYFHYFLSRFDKMARPVMGIAYYDEGKIRILGRALVNKKLVNETTFELREARRFSPLSDVFIGGTAIYSTIKNEGRAKEKHEIEMEILEYQRDKAKADAESARYQALLKRIEVYEKLETIARESDVTEYQNITPGLVRAEIHHAYALTSNKNQRLLADSGMKLDEDSIHIIDIKA